MTNSNILKMYYNAKSTFLWLQIFSGFRTRYPISSTSVQSIYKDFWKDHKLHPTALTSYRKALKEKKSFGIRVKKMCALSSQNHLPMERRKKDALNFSLSDMNQRKKCTDYSAWPHLQEIYNVELTFCFHTALSKGGAQAGHTLWAKRNARNPFRWLLFPVWGNTLLCFLQMEWIWKGSQKYNRTAQVYLKEDNQKIGPVESIKLRSKPWVVSSGSFIKYLNGGLYSRTSPENAFEVEIRVTKNLLTPYSLQNSESLLLFIARDRRNK